MTTDYVCINETKNLATAVAELTMEKADSLKEAGIISKEQWQSFIKRNYNILLRYSNTDNMTMSQLKTFMVLVKGIYNQLWNIVLFNQQKLLQA